MQAFLQVKGAIRIPSPLIRPLAGCTSLDQAKRTRERGARSLPLEQRARRCGEPALKRVCGSPRYVAAWSMFFGSKMTPQLSRRSNAYRARSEPMFSKHIAAIFPELIKHYPQPELFAAVVFATSRGSAVARPVAVAESATEGRLAVWRT